MEDQFIAPIGMLILLEESTEHLGKYFSTGWKRKLLLMNKNQSLGQRKMRPALQSRGRDNQKLKTKQNKETKKKQRRLGIMRTHGKGN